MNLRCVLGFHYWSKWRDNGEGKISIFGFLTKGNSLSSEPVLLQEKICGACNIKKRRYVKYKSS